MASSTFVDIAILQDYRKRNLLRCQQHPTRDLFVWNYMDSVQAKGAWDEITKQARGLITDSKGAVKARSFKKFHNIEQNLHTPSAEFTVYEKLDGSLIILFWDEDEWIVASRGSFESTQSAYASKLIETKYDISGLDKSLAYSFEVIYPENRIVVDYKDRKELVFLAAFAKDGTEVDVSESIASTRIPVVKQYAFDDYKTIKSLNWENSEGFVVRFSNGERVKIKFEDYLDLHGKLTHLNALTLWKSFSSGASLESVLEDIPDEYYDWVQKKWMGFTQDYKARKTAVDAEYAALCDAAGGDRKQFAIRASRSPNKGMLFAMFDKRSMDTDPILQAIKPENGLFDVPYSGKVSTAPSERTPPKSGSILLLIGPSGSGKSTWASEYVRAHPSAIRVNRDAMRQQLYGYTPDTMSSYYTHPSLQKREDVVTQFETTLIRDALKDGYDVVVDNTNLNAVYIQRYRKTFPYTTISYKIMDTPLETCIERDRARPSPVGKEEILRQYEKLEVMCKSSVFKKLDTYVAPLLMQDTSLPKAYIFDLDGTLADCSKRSPYDWASVETDSVILPVKETLLAHKMQGYAILICTGRDEICREKTCAWMAANGIVYDGVYMRPHRNALPDWVIKETMWSEISKTYCIVALYDDRNSVVEHARRCGFHVFQVADGDY